jgi:hypothetical protein
MANPDDPDFSSVDALPDGTGSPKLSTELDAVGKAIKATTVGVSGDTKGRTPEAVTDAATAVAQASSTMADNAAVVEAAAKVLRDAEAAWKKAAPKKKDLDDADKALDDSRKALAAAQIAEEDARDKYNAALNAPDVGGYNSGRQGVIDAAKSTLDKAIAATKKASEAHDKALAHVVDLKQKRKAADDAYEAQRKLAAEKLKTLKPVDTGGWQGGQAGDTPRGSGLPSGDNGKPAAGNGTGGGSSNPGSAVPAAKAPGAATPAAKTPGASTPAAATPDSKTGTGSGGGIDPSTLAAAALLSQGQQNQQQQQPQAQTQQMPTMPQVPQQAAQSQQPKQGDGKSDLEKQADANSLDALTRAGLVAPTAVLSGLGGSGAGSPSPVTATAAQAPAAPSGPTTHLRTDFNAAQAGANPTSQVPPTTGTSKTDLVTTQGNREVGGRPTGTENRPFSATPDGVATKTSGADGSSGTATGTKPGVPATGTPGLGGLPHVGGVPVAAGGGGSHGKNGDKDPILRHLTPEQALLNGHDTLSESVAYTIAQNKPRRGEAA